MILVDLTATLWQSSDIVRKGLQRSQKGNKTWQSTKYSTARISESLSRISAAFEPEISSTVTSSALARADEVCEVIPRAKLVSPNTKPSDTNRKMSPVSLHKIILGSSGCYVISHRTISHLKIMHMPANKLHFALVYNE